MYKNGSLGNSIGLEYLGGGNIWHPSQIKEGSFLSRRDAIKTGGLAALGGLVSLVNNSCRTATSPCEPIVIPEPLALPEAGNKNFSLAVEVPPRWDAKVVLKSNGYHVYPANPEIRINWDRYGLREVEPEKVIAEFNNATAFAIRKWKERGKAIDEWYLKLRLTIEITPRLQIADVYGCPVLSKGKTVLEKCLSEERALVQVVFYYESEFEKVRYDTPHFIEEEVMHCFGFTHEDIQ